MDSVEPNHPNPSSQSPNSDSSKRDNTASIASESEETRSRRRRRSRWDSSPSETEGTTRKRKSRWADDEPKPIVQLPDFMKGIEFDPEIQVLNCRLLEISRILQSGLPLDDREEGQRSPSPEPIYDNLGVRVNTREYRAKEKLNREKQEIISEMIKRNPAFKPPAGYRPPKLQKKIFLPVKEYPGYNFIGLIIGPRGNTQKRMEKETGAKIVIRGKGSEKEGRNQQKKDFKYGSSDNEDLHVFIEAETQEALDAAAGMVEKFLQVDEGVNEHKRKQLRELATLNGTVRDEELCRQCGETGHRQYECPNARAVTFKSEVLCKICGDGGHPTVDCPVKGTTGKKMNDEYLKFLAEVGATVPESSPKQSPGSNPHPGLGSSPTKEYDETNLYIGCLPRTLEDSDLINLFTSFGDIVKAKVIKDHGSGQSKGYGFVKYADVKMANAAIQSMNGYWLEGRTLAVRIAGKPPPPTAPQRSPSSQPPTQAYPSQQYVTVGYSTAPVPWGPTVPSYSMYPPPPPPGSYYPVPGQHSSPYGMYYPPPPPPPHVTEAPPPGTVPQNPSSSDSQQIPGQSPYTSYPSYYNAVPPPMPDLSTDHSQSMGNFSTSDHSQGLGNAPWESNPPMPPTVGYSQSMESVPSAPEPLVQPPAENPSAVRDSEFEKFMADLKYHACSEKKVHPGGV